MRGFGYQPRVLTWLRGQESADVYRAEGCNWWFGGSYAVK